MEQERRKQFQRSADAAGKPAQPAVGDAALPAAACDEEGAAGGAERQAASLDPTPGPALDTAPEGLQRVAAAAGRCGEAQERVSGDGPAVPLAAATAYLRRGCDSAAEAGLPEAPEGSAPKAGAAAGRRSRTQDKPCESQISSLGSGATDAGCGAAGTGASAAAVDTVHSADGAGTRAAEGAPLPHAGAPAAGCSAISAGGTRPSGDARAPESGSAGARSSARGTGGSNSIAAGQHAAPSSSTGKLTLEAAGAKAVEFGQGTGPSCGAGVPTLEACLASFFASEAVMWVCPAETAARKEASGAARRAGRSRSVSFSGAPVA